MLSPYFLPFALWFLFSASVMLHSVQMKWLRFSLILQMILAFYFQAILWFPLGSWNDQPGKRLIVVVRDGPASAAAAVAFAIAMALPVLLFALAVWKRWRWLMWVGLVGYGAWAVLQIQSWWLPWLFGTDQRTLNNQKFLVRTLKIFPSTPAHPAPDAMHFVLDLFLFASVATLACGLYNFTREFFAHQPGTNPKPS